MPSSGLNDRSCVTVMLVPVLEPADATTVAHVSFRAIIYVVQVCGTHSLELATMEQLELRKGLDARMSL